MTADHATEGVLTGSSPHPSSPLESTTTELKREAADVQDIPESTPAAPVDGAGLFDEVEAFHRRFNAFPSEHAYVAVTLWDAHTHLLDYFDSTPRLAFLSPEPGSGKTRALEVIESLVPTPMRTENCSPAALFRSVSDLDSRPTLLFDEIDTVFGPKAKDNEELRGLINAGHRRGGKALRCVAEGSKQTVREFPAYAALACAGLGGLPDTILSRSIVIPMRRRGPGEEVESWRQRLHPHEGHALRERLATWASQVREEVAGSWPDLPDGLSDRPADVWEPLISIADTAGGSWPARARAAAMWFVEQAKRLDRVSLGVRLLADIKTVFDARSSDKISTADLLDELCAMDDAPWASLRGEPLDARGLATYLRRYEDGDGYPISSKKIRIDTRTAQGYTKALFFDAWQRYVPKEETTEADASVLDAEKSGTTGTTGTQQASTLFEAPESVPDQPRPEQDPDREIPM